MKRLRTPEKHRCNHRCQRAGCRWARSRPRTFVEKSKVSKYWYERSESGVVSLLWMLTLRAGLEEHSPLTTTTAAATNLAAGRLEDNHDTGAENKAAGSAIRRSSTERPRLLPVSSCGQLYNTSNRIRPLALRRMTPLRGFARRRSGMETFLPSRCQLIGGRRRWFH